MEIKTKAKIREWGNSLGVIIPKDIVIKEELRPNDQVTITISKGENLEGFFGKMKANVDAQKMKDESRKIWQMD